MMLFCTETLEGGPDGQFQRYRVVYSGATVGRFRTTDDGNMYICFTQSLPDVF